LSKVVRTLLFPLKKLAQRIYNLFDVRHHLSAYVFVSIFVSVVVISTVLIVAYSFTAVDDFSQVSIQNAQNVVDTIGSQLDSYTNSVAQTHTLLLSSDGIRNYLETRSGTMPSYSWFQIYSDARSTLLLCARSQYTLISGMRLTRSTGETIKYGSLNAIPTLTSHDYNRLLFRNGHALYASTFSDGYGAQNYLMTQMYDSAIDRLCTGLVMPGSALILSDESGEVFRQYVIDADGRKQLSLYNAGRIDGLQSVQADFGGGMLHAVMLLPYTPLREKLAGVVPFLFPLAFFALVSGFLLSYSLSRKVKRSFKVMERNIQLVESRSYNEVATIPTQDEFGHLSRTFAHMALRIDELIAENQQRERTAHELEIQVLRAQISPHFLSNALNSVRSLAAMQGMDHIERLITAIIRLLRASLASTDTLVTLEQELEYVHNYMSICQYQYLNDIDLTVDVDEKLLGCPMPPMVLQPIVENAIIHGIADFRSDGSISITARREGNALLLTVTDNGQGMTAEQVQTLLRQERNVNKRRFSGIGLHNVLRRIRMRFGDDYGLHIDSQPGEYTMVQVTLPYKESVE